MKSAPSLRESRSILTTKKAKEPSEVARALAAPSQRMGGLYGLFPVEEGVLSQGKGDENL
jgi:hypothetical protein